MTHFCMDDDGGVRLDLTNAEANALLTCLLKPVSSANDARESRTAVEKITSFLQFATSEQRRRDEVNESVDIAEEAQKEVNTAYQEVQQARYVLMQALDDLDSFHLKQKSGAL